MCLGVPGKVLAVDGMNATVDFFGVTKRVRLDVVDAPVAEGDYVLNHVGFAIRRIPEEEIGETLALYEELLAHGPEGDLMASDVRGELDASSAVATAKATGTAGAAAPGTVGARAAGTGDGGDDGDR